MIIYHIVIILEILHSIVFHTAVTANCTDRFGLVIRVQCFLCRAGNEIDCVNKTVRIHDSRVKQVLHYGAFSV